MSNFPNLRKIYFWLIDKLEKQNNHIILLRSLRFIYVQLKVLYAKHLFHLLMLRKIISKVAEGDK